MTNLNTLKDRAYKNAVAHGWHEEELSNEHFLCLVISELMEAVEADRKNRYAKRNFFIYSIDYALRELHLTEKDLNNYFRNSFNDNIKDSVEDELADSVIRLLDYCGTFNFVIDDSCSDSEAIEDFSRLFKKMTFTESIFHIVESISRFEIQVSFLKIFGFCKKNNIDILWHIEQKMKYNELRPYKHDGKKY